MRRPAVVKGETRACIRAVNTTFDIAVHYQEQTQDKVRKVGDMHLGGAV